MHTVASVLDEVRIANAATRLLFLLLASYGHTLLLRYLLCALHSLQQQGGRSALRYVHPDLPIRCAEKLGARSLRDRILADRGGTAAVPCPPLQLLRHLFMPAVGAHASLSTTLRSPPSAGGSAGGGGKMAAATEQDVKVYGNGERAQRVNENVFFFDAACIVRHLPFGSCVQLTKAMGPERPRYYSNRRSNSA